MKFLYINNQLCAGCNKCFDTCPTKAIYHSEEKMYINYDKCISCGNCFRECLHQAISIEKIEKIAREIESLAENKLKINNLEKENVRLREELANVSSGLNNIIQKLPIATIITDSNTNIIYANKTFIELLDYKTTELIEERAALTGMPLKDCGCSDIYDMFINVMLGDNDIINSFSTINNRKVSISVYSIKKREITLGVIRDITQPDVANQETVLRIKDSIDRQMAMVQKIGFLLGEEVSEISKNLDSVIKIIDDVK